MVKINNIPYQHLTQLSAYKEYLISDKSGETTDGSRHIYVKGTRWNVSCTLKRMNSSEMKAFLSSITGPVVTVEFRNPKTETAETITATLATPIISYLRRVESGRVLFDELPLTFTEV